MYKAIVAASAGIVAAGALIVGIVWLFSTPVGVGVAVPVVLAAMWLGLVAAGGFIALRRDSLEEQGLPYAQTFRRESVRCSFLGRWFAALRRLLRSRDDSSANLGLRPGEPVEIRSLAEIVATLDAHGTLDGVPFMPEMAAYCGRRARVFRRVDKLNDWVRGTALNRMRNLVLLENLRCDGSAHDGCQAGCHLRWREVWLRRVTSQQSLTVGYDQARETNPVADHVRLRTRREHAGEGARYLCQATELAVSGVPMRWADPRHYVRDLLTGNVCPGPFFVGVALACFNWVQRQRGGVGFPVYAPGGSERSPQDILGLQAGELVRVKAKHSIEKTLNKQSRNRGLRFDPEMFRFCGGEYRVNRRVERVIVEKTGELRSLTNPCIVLEGVTATGEYVAFNPENEEIFWREAWLERTSSSGAHRTSAVEPDASDRGTAS